MHDVIQKKMIVTQNNEYSHISVKTVLRSVNLGSFKLIQVMLVALLTSAFLGAGGVLAGSCEPPVVEHGQVSGKGNDNSWVGTVSCANGFTLVGDPRLKCRGGRWSSSNPPLCAGGSCDSSKVPKVEHAEIRPYKPFKYRGSVFDYKCKPGFKRVGFGKAVCGGQSWSLGEPTICAKKGCDESSVNAISFGHAEKKLHGAVFVFRCEEGGVLEGSPLLFCDGSRWNGTAPQCMRALLTPTLTLDPLEGPYKVSQAVSVVCVGQEVEPPSIISLELAPEDNSSTLVLGLASDGHLAIDISEYLVPSMNQAVLRCIASNEEGSSQTKQTEIRLDIIHGPERVILSGPETSQAEQEVEYKCSSSPSNPGATLKWETHDAHDGTKSSTAILVGKSAEVWTGTGWESHSSAKVTIPEGAKGLAVKCIAENERIGHQVATQKILRVQYAPDDLSVEGPDSVAQGETVILRCKSSAGFPAPTLQWTIRRDGVEEVTETDEVSYQEATMDSIGGASVTSDLTFEAGPPGKIEVECYAEHPTLGQNKKAFSHILQIIEKTLEEKSGDAKNDETEEDDVATERSNGDVNEPREGQVKSASTSKGSQVQLTWSILALLLLLLDSSR